MFTGIIKYTGEIKNIQKSGLGKKITIKTDYSFIKQLEIGYSSISINGACHTVDNVFKDNFTVYSSPETLSKTNFNYLINSSIVNLELPINLNSPLDGHLVLGHIDGIGKIINIEKLSESFIFTYEIDNSLSIFLIEKDSIAIDGISLTIFNIKNNQFNVAIIPQTIEHTNLKYKKIHDLVNIELNIFSKYAYKFLKEKFEVKALYDKIKNFLNS